jgi:hypothetical protein
MTFRVLAAFAFEAPVRCARKVIFFWKLAKSEPRPDGSGSM